MTASSAWDNCRLLQEASADSETGSCRHLDHRHCHRSPLIDHPPFPEATSASASGLGASVVTVDVARRVLGTDSGCERTVGEWGAPLAAQASLVSALGSALLGLCDQPGGRCAQRSACAGVPPACDSPARQVPVRPRSSSVLSVADRGGTARGQSLTAGERQALPRWLPHARTHADWAGPGTELSPALLPALQSPGWAGRLCLRDSGQVQASDGPFTEHAVGAALSERKWFQFLCHLRLLFRCLPVYILLVCLTFFLFGK